MKKPTKKIAQYSSLAMGAIALMPLGCKEDDVDDPNITVRDISITVSPTAFDLNDEEAIDIDNNAVNDVYLGIWKSSDPGDFRAAWIGRYGTNLVMASTISGYQSATAFAEGAMIDGTSAGDDYGYTSVLQASPAPVLDLGFAGDGNKYFGVKFKIGANNHYGWLRGSVSADGLTFTINKVGYDIRPDTGIKAGAE